MVILYDVLKYKQMTDGKLPTVEEVMADVRKCIEELNKKATLALEAISDLQELQPYEDNLKGLHKLIDDTKELQNTITNIKEINKWT